MHMKDDKKLSADHREEQNINAAPVEEEYRHKILDRLDDGENPNADIDETILPSVFTGAMTLEELLNLANTQTEQLRKLFANYSCAAMEIETKFKVLNQRFSVKYDSNPIESIKTRVKSPESIVRKLYRRNLPITLESMENNLTDIAGIRVICSFVEDIYTLAEYFLQQDDIVLVERKDYIQNPKPGGYRSLHLIVRVPIFTEFGKKWMTAEVQMRTIAMDFWASLEHKIRYKKEFSEEQFQYLSHELRDCADVSASLDLRMQAVRKALNDFKE